MCVVYTYIGLCRFVYACVLPLAAAGAVARPPGLSWPAPAPPACGASPKTRRGREDQKMGGDGQKDKSERWQGTLGKKVRQMESKRKSQNAKNGEKHSKKKRERKISTLV